MKTKTIPGVQEKALKFDVKMSIRCSLKTSSGDTFSASFSQVFPTMWIGTEQELADMIASQRDPMIETQKMTLEKQGKGLFEGNASTTIKFLVPKASQEDGADPSSDSCSITLKDAQVLHFDKPGAMLDLVHERMNEVSSLFGDVQVAINTAIDTINQSPQEITHEEVVARCTREIQRAI